MLHKATDYRGERDGKDIKFYSVFSIPQCLGAIDGTHIKIKQPSLNSTDCINRKSRYALSVQAFCDYRCCFMDVVVKWPGRIHDAKMFANSRLNQLLKTCAIPPCRITIQDEKMPVLIIDDTAYPLI